jgi:hypothetical protein
VFNGSSSWIANSPNIGFGQSISMWFDVDSGISVGQQGLWSQSVNGGLVWAGANLYWDGSNFSFSMFIRNSAYRYQSAGIISVNAGWNHIVFTFDNNAGYSAWLNNSQLTMTNSNVSGTVSSFPSGTTTIGRQWGNNDDFYFNGSIDQVRIFNKALNSTEVTTLYNETACDALACGGTTNTLDILSDGSCIAAYPLDGSPADLSGNYNGVQTDVTYPVGEFDLAGSFNGTSSVLVGSVGGLFTSKTTSSVSLWFKSSSSEGGNRWLFADYDSTSFNYVVYLNAPSVGKIRFLSRYSSSTTAIDSVSGGLNNGAWHHLVVMVDIENLKNRIYIDGSFESEGNLSSNAYNGSGALGYIGGGVIGEIDQVRIFNKALSAAEVTTLYNETACN